MTAWAPFLFSIMSDRFIFLFLIFFNLSSLSLVQGRSFDFFGYVIKSRSAAALVASAGARGSLVFFSGAVISRMSALPTSSELVYSGMWWLERELSELLGFFFENKSDSRNLLLEYSNSFRPLSRAFPVAGLFEIFYLYWASILSLSWNALQV